MIDLQEFIDIHERALHLFALKISRSEDDAEDLLQDTWLKCISNQFLLANMTTSGQRSWLFSVLKNRWLDICRHRNLERLYVSRYIVPAISSNEVNIEPYLDTLNAMEQSVVKMKYWQGMNSREIAAELNIPEGTVRWRLKLALEHLRKAILQSNREEKCLL